jgi:hypothetical protein
VKLDEIISYVPLEPTKLEVLIFYVNDILKYISNIIILNLTVTLLFNSIILQIYGQKEL